MRKEVFVDKEGRFLLPYEYSNGVNIIESGEGY